MDLEYFKYQLDDILRVATDSRYHEDKKKHNNEKLNNLITSAHETIYELSDEEILKYVLLSYEKKYNVLPFVNELMDRFHCSIDSIEKDIRLNAFQTFFIINQLIFEDNTLIHEKDFISMVNHFLNHVSFDDILNSKPEKNVGKVLQCELLEILVKHYGSAYETDFSQSNFYIIAAFLHADMKCFQYLETQNVKFCANQLGQTPFDLYFLSHMHEDDFFHNSQDLKILDYLIKKEKNLNIEHSYKPNLMQELIKRQEFKAIEYLESHDFNYSKPSPGFYVQLIEQALSDLSVNSHFPQYSTYCQKYEQMKIKIEQEALDKLLIDKSQNTNKKMKI